MDIHFKSFRTFFLQNNPIRNLYFNIILDLNMFSGNALESLCYISLD